MAPKKEGKSGTVKPSHPPYGVMASRAITELKEHNGSSLQAISKYIQQEYKIEINKTALSQALKKGLESGDLTRVKASYKIKKKNGESEKSTEKKVETKVKKVLKKTSIKKADPVKPKKSIGKKKRGSKKTGTSGTGDTITTAKPKAPKKD
mmetsp:Transcript_17845/g.37060  ORF Transcript_17845/g.37060 Transcript_17845/m.37060 type:complete len:151 (-) Transcript_17845:383-835(-)|eukprot:CAMPEP_0184681966 /NCGR_PEP_ID=MMETSP0312-20130426/5137_1 /TAXON_ID=31354 /ORGANISM="Compsopogon coeruleus, Strain SAG 36.94" /LENGTH=150 /DNA_ID=CAMNT_0027133151 /DNA_START=144 /DNA_END=596 /DNA_ORIENTATION=-